MSSVWEEREGLKNRVPSLGEEEIWSVGEEVCKGGGDSLQDNVRELIVGRSRGKLWRGWEGSEC